MIIRRDSPTEGKQMSESFIAQKVANDAMLIIYSDHIQLNAQSGQSISNLLNVAPGLC